MSSIQKKIEIEEENTIEFWMDLPEEFMLSRYQISNTGKVRNKNTDYLFTRRLNESGYVVVNLKMDNDINRYFRVHILVANTFLENPENKPTVDHIDRVRHNNNVNNLRFATYREQLLNREIYKRKGTCIKQYDMDGNFIRKWDSIINACIEYEFNYMKLFHTLTPVPKEYGGFKWSYDLDDLPGEIWKEYHPDYDIKVSNKGRIQFGKYKRTYGNLNGEYMSTTILNTVTKENHIIRVNRLVCMVFKPHKKQNELVVNHLNEIKTDNSIENLQWVTVKRNNLYSLDRKTKERNNARSQIVVQIDYKTKEILNEFSSTTEAGIYAKVNRTNIYACCINQYAISGGYAWQFKEKLKWMLDPYTEKKVLYIKPASKSGIKGKPLFQIDIENQKIIKEYDSIAKAANETGVDSKVISRCCNTLDRLLTAKDFIWIYVEDYFERGIPKKLLVTSRGNTVLQIDIRTKEIIGKFDRIQDALNFINIPRGTGIAVCCQGKQETAYGFMWCFEKNYEKFMKNLPVLTSKQLNTVIVKIDPSTKKIIEKFKNLDDMVEKTGLSKSMVSRCYNTNFKRTNGETLSIHKGYIWNLEVI